MFHTNEKSRKIVDTVVDDITDMVISTMGPNGKLAIIEYSNRPKATKDGVTVAKSIKYDDIAYDLVAQIMTEAAIRTDRECGDGTTTTIFLTSALYNSFKDVLNFNNKALLNGYVKEVISFIKQNIIKVSVSDERLYHLALTTSNNDATIVDNVLRIYKDYDGLPNILTREGVKDADEFEETKGLVLPAMFASPIFSLNGTGNPLTVNNFIPIVIDNNVKLVNPSDLETFIENVCAMFKNDSGDIKTKLVIAARGFEHDFLMGINRINSQLKYIAIIPLIVEAGGSIGSGIMGDVATIMNCEMLGELSQLKDYTGGYYNHDIIVSMQNTKIVNPDEGLLSRIAERIKGIRNEIGSLPINKQDGVIGKLLNKRINRLDGGEVTIYVGGLTNSDIKERIDRYVDVIQAVRTALEGGIIPGCGSVLVRASDELGKRHTDDLSVKLQKVLNSQYLYLMNGIADTSEREFVNLATGEKSDSPEKLGIYDAANATITALEVALKTSVMLADISSVILGNKFGSVMIDLQN